MTWPCRKRLAALLPASRIFTNDSNALEANQLIPGAPGHKPTWLKRLPAHEHSGAAQQ
jgi:hypothetical protein